MEKLINKQLSLNLLNILKSGNDKELIEFVENNKHFIYSLCKSQSNLKIKIPLLINDFNPHNENCKCTLTNNLIEIVKSYFI